MGSDSDLPVMQGAVDVLTEFGVPHEVRVVSRAPHARRDVRVRAPRRRPRPAGDHRRRGRRRAPPGHDRVDDVAPRDRRTGATAAARRARLAAVDRADARRHPGGDGRRREGAQRRAPGGPHPRRGRRGPAGAPRRRTAPRSTRACARRTPSSVAVEDRARASPRTTAMPSAPSAVPDACAIASASRARCDSSVSSRLVCSSRLAAASACGRTRGQPGGERLGLGGELVVGHHRRDEPPVVRLRAPTAPGW